MPGYQEVALLKAEIGADISGLHNGLRQANRALTGFAQSGSAKLRALGSGMTSAGMGLASMTAPLVGTAKNMISTAADFETAMNDLSVAAGGSGASLGQLRKAAELVGADNQLVGISASQAAASMTEFSRQGLTVSDMFGGQFNKYLRTGTNLTGAFRAAIDLQAASEQDLGQSTETIIGAMSTFHIKASDATSITEEFVRQANASQAGVSDLNDALGNAGPTLSSYGYSLHDSLTALSLLSQYNIKGAEAGTALKSAFTHMLNPTKKETQLLKKLNVSFYTAHGRVKAMPVIIGELQHALAGLTQEQRIQAVQTLAGSYGQKAMLSLLDQGVGGWNNMEKAVKDSASAQEVAGAKTKGLNAAMEQLNGVLETIMIEVGTPFIQGFLTPAVKALGDFLSYVMKTHPGLLKMAAAIGGILIVLGPLLIITGSVISAIGTIGTAASAMGAVLGGAGVLGPLLGILGPIAAVGVAAYVLYRAWTEDWGGIKEVVGDAGDFINGALDSVDGDIGGLAGRAKSKWSSLKIDITTKTHSMWDDVRHTTTTALAGLKLGLHRDLSIARDTSNRLWSQIKTGTLTRLHAMVSEEQKGLMNMRNAVTNAFETAKARAMGAMHSLEAGIAGIFTGIVNSASNAGRGLIDAFKNGITSGLNGVLDVVRNIVQQIRDLLPGSDAKTGPLSTLTHSGMSLMSVFGNGVESGASNFFHRIGKIVTGIKDTLAGGAKDTDYRGGYQRAMPQLPVAVHGPEGYQRAMPQLHNGPQLYYPDTGETWWHREQREKDGSNDSRNRLRHATDKLKDAITKGGGGSLRDILKGTPVSRHKLATGGEDTLKGVPVQSRFLPTPPGTTPGGRYGGGGGGTTPGPARCDCSSERPISIIIHNPKPEGAPESIRRELMLLSAAGVLA